MIIFNHLRHPVPHNSHAESGLQRSTLMIIIIQIIIVITIFLLIMPVQNRACKGVCGGAGAQGATWWQTSPQTSPSPTTAGAQAQAQEQASTRVKASTCTRARTSTRVKASTSADIAFVQLLNNIQKVAEKVQAHM